MDWVCPAISFMEAWLKFRAPGITVPLGLGIGRLVLMPSQSRIGVCSGDYHQHLLNTTEILKWQNLLCNTSNAFIYTNILALTRSDARAELHIQGQIVPPSNLHFYYVGLELVKVASSTILV
ncbi:MAG: hypothetical protein IPP56_16845 [Bacteroidetes bacterium]|nr:hypothetical protein [Bacteroidota bacterium]